MSKLKGSSEILAKGGFRVSRRELLKASSSIGRTKTLTSHLFTPLFMFIHLPLIHFAPPPRSLIDFKNSKWPIFCILLCICCFSHLIGLLSVTWLSLLYKFTWFFCLVSVSLIRIANAQNVRLYTISIASLTTFLYYFRKIFPTRVEQVWPRLI